MSGSKSRTKGHSYERAIAKRFRKWAPEARRGLQYRDGADAPDVILDGFRVECKRLARPTIGDVYRALDQVHGDAPDAELPVVIMRPDRRDDVVVMRLETFEELARSWRRL